MHRFRALMAVKPRLATLLPVVVALVVAACKSGGGSSGY